METKNFRHPNRNRARDLAPSGTILTSPDIDDVASEQYQICSGNMKHEFNLSGVSEYFYDNSMFEDVDGSRVNSDCENKLVTGSSPTSSQSSYSGRLSAADSSSKNKPVVDLGASDSQEGRRRHVELPPSVGKEEKKLELHKLLLQTQKNFCKRAPGFPQVNYFPFDYH